MGSQCLLAASAGYTHSSIMGENPEIWKAAAMADHFDKIQKLTEKIDGVPNFRRVPGYKVYCCGQPTIAGFEAAINKACGETYPKTNKIIWLNMRQEPIVYVNGNPICARPPNKIGEYAELGNVTRESVKKDEEEFLRVIEGKAKGNDGKVKVVDVNKKESEIEVKELTTLSLVIEGLKEKYPGLVHMRIPVCNSAAPLEADFDTLCKTMQGSAVNCPVIVNCQAGLSRSTTGIKQLRENIAESKLSYEIMDDAAQAFLKTKIMDNIHKYFYLICFTAYLREAAILCKDAASEDDKKAFSLTGGKVSTPADQLKLNKSFVDYMSEHSKLRTIVDEGKGKLQWERDIPPEALANLESLAASDFKGNLGKIIHDIYRTAHGLFKDLPQGDHKKRAKYRFASKTLMRVLPSVLKAEVEGLIANQTMTLDLYEILGQCTWGQAKA